MENTSTIQVYVKINGGNETKLSIPYDINEIELKVLLQNFGYISFYRDSYRTTKVYLLADDKLEEICIDKYRSLKQLNIVQGSHILIKPGISEPQRIVYQHFYPAYYSRNNTRRSSGGGRALYGCPMAQRVIEAISEAEQYSEEDSSITTGIIDFAD